MSSNAVTEIALLPISTSTPFDDPSTSSGQTWSSCIKTLSSQPGFQRVVWGRQTATEDPRVMFLVDWDTLEAHKNFMASQSYTPFMKDFGSILDGPALLYHASLSPLPPEQATSAPVTQYLTMYLPTSLPPSRKEFFERHISTFGKMAELHGDGWRHASIGWIEEELEHKGEKKKAFAIMAGWDSVEHERKYKTTGAFEGWMGGLRDHSDGVDMGFWELNGGL